MTDEPNTDTDLAKVSDEARTAALRWLVTVMQENIAEESIQAAAIILEYT